MVSYFYVPYFQRYVYFSYSEFYRVVLGSREQRSIGMFGAISKAVPSSMRAVGRRVVQGSPGSTRPLRLLPVRARRLADQYHNSWSNFNSETSSQENDNSIHIGNQEGNSNVNNMLGGGSGGSHAGDFNAGVTPVNVQTTISTTFSPTFHRQTRRFRNHPSSYEYEYDEYDYYAPVEPVRPVRPLRRRFHHRRQRTRKQTASTTVTPDSVEPDANPRNSESAILQDLINRGLLDPSDLAEFGYISNGTNQAISPVRTRRFSGDMDIVEPSLTIPNRLFQLDHFRYENYENYLSTQRDEFWDQVIPIMVQFELDFNIEITIYNDPIQGIFTPYQSLNVGQKRNPYPVLNRTRRSDGTELSELPNPDTESDLESPTYPNFTSFIEIRNITRKFHEKTSFTTSKQSAYHIPYKAICLCILVVIAIFAFSRCRHNPSE